MKALIYDRYSKDDDFSEILQIREIDEPVAGPNDVVFRVRAAALNYDDIWGMRGKPIEIPMPHISGTDAAGDVVQVGKDVKDIKVGDRVVSHGNLSCRVCSACTDGREYDCKSRRVWGFQTGPLWGGYCEMTHLPEVNTVRIPDGIRYEEAAAASMTLMTSWHMLISRGRIRPGQTVLVMGGGSGMGIFGIQIAKLFGCDVIATASSDKLDRCKSIGADYAVDHRRDDWHEDVRQIVQDLARSKGKECGIDVIYEHIGGTHWNKELGLLKYGGTIVTTGATTGYDVQTDLREVFVKGINILGSTQGTRAELEAGLYWMSQGKIRAVIDSEFSLEQAVQAHTRMLNGKGLFGKIIMRP